MATANNLPDINNKNRNDELVVACIAVAIALFLILAVPFLVYYVVGMSTADDWTNKLEIKKCLMNF